MRGSEASQRLLKGFSACTIWRSGGGEKGARCALWARHLFLMLAARRRGERWVGGAAHLTDGARHGPRRNFLLRRRRGGGGVPGKRHGLRTRRSRRGSRRRRKSLQGETSARARECERSSRYRYARACVATGTCEAARRGLATQEITGAQRNTRCHEKLYSFQRAVVLSPNDVPVCCLSSLLTSYTFSIFFQGPSLKVSHVPSLFTCDCHSRMLCLSGRAGVMPWSQFGSRPHDLHHLL